MPDCRGLWERRSREGRSVGLCEGGDRSYAGKSEPTERAMSENRPTRTYDDECPKHPVFGDCALVDGPLFGGRPNCRLQHLQRVSVDMTRIACCACADSMWNLSDRPKVRRTAGRSVSMQPAVRPLGWMRPSICTRSSLTSIPPMPPKTRSTNPAPPRLFSLASQQPVLEPVSERLVKRVGLH